MHRRDQRKGAKTQRIGWLWPILPAQQTVIGAIASKPSFSALRLCVKYRRRQTPSRVCLRGEIRLLLLLLRVFLGWFRTDAQRHQFQSATLALVVGSGDVLADRCLLEQGGFARFGDFSVGGDVEGAFTNLDGLGILVDRIRFAVKWDVFGCLLLRWS